MWKQQKPPARKRICSILNRRGLFVSYFILELQARGFLLLQAHCLLLCFSTEIIKISSIFCNSFYVSAQIVSTLCCLGQLLHLLIFDQKLHKSTIISLTFSLAVEDQTIVKYLPLFFNSSAFYLLRSPWPLSLKASLVKRQGFTPMLTTIRPIPNSGERQ